MGSMDRKYSLIYSFWQPLADEYILFLNRYKIDTVSSFSDRQVLGINVDIYADEDKYLTLLFENENFKQEEEQLIRLFNRIENISLTLYDALMEDSSYDEDYYESFYDNGSENLGDDGYFETDF